MSPAPAARPLPTCGTVACCCERVGQTHPWEVPSGRNVDGGLEGAGLWCDGGAVRGSQCASRQCGGDRAGSGHGSSSMGSADTKVPRALAGLSELAAWLGEAGVTLRLEPMLFDAFVGAVRASAGSPASHQIPPLALTHRLVQRSGLVMGGFRGTWSGTPARGFCMPNRGPAVVRSLAQ
jgi:hypothetical protein